MTVMWREIEQLLPVMRPVTGGYSTAKRGLVTLQDGRDVFVKIGVDDASKHWTSKEVRLYRMLERHGYPHAPRLIAANTDETALVIEALLTRDGWNWRDEWDEARLHATLAAMDDLSRLSLSVSERQLLSRDRLDQEENGWVKLCGSEEKRTVLQSKLTLAGADDILKGMDFDDERQTSMQYDFRQDTLVHLDVRTDNCAWNGALGAVRLVDWNWVQRGDRDIDRATMLTHVVRAGMTLPPDIERMLNPAALRWMAGFWFNAAATPIWPGGKPELRDMQLAAGMTAWRIAAAIQRVK